MDMVADQISDEKKEIAVLPGSPTGDVQFSAAPDPEHLLKSLELCLSAAGHEIRMPLAMMRLGAELIQRTLPNLSPLAGRFLSLVASESARMVDLVDNWLARELLRGGALRWNWSQVRLSEVCAQAAALLGPLMHIKATRLRTDFQPPDLQMRGDPGAITQLILNLLHDTYRAVYGGELALECIEIESAQGDSRWVVLTVTSSRGGESASDLRKSMERLRTPPFWPTFRDAPEGGLGLAIARTIVGAHGGYMRFRTGTDQGVVIKVHLQADLAEPRPALPCQIIAERGCDA